MPYQGDYELKKLVNEGYEIAEKKENHSWLRSSFKRIVKGWESDIEKIEKLKRIQEKLGSDYEDLQNKLGEESKDKAKKSKYNKEKEKLEKEKKKLEERDAKLTSEIKSLVNKLNQKMEKEADEYLAKTKNLVGEDENKVLIKNPQLHKKINKAKQDLQNNIKWFNDIIDEAGKLYHDEEKMISDKELYEPFCEYYYENVASKNITQSTPFNKWMEDIKFDKQKDNTPLTRGFSTWLKEELFYLEKFKNKTITISELFDYYNHNAYINKTLIDKIPAKKIKSATTGYFEKLPKSLLRKILLAIGIPAATISFFTIYTAPNILKASLFIILSPIAIILNIFFNDFNAKEKIKGIGKDILGMPKAIFVKSANQAIKHLEYIESIGKETFSDSFIKELSNGKIKIDSPANKTLASLTNKTTKKINKLEDELKKLEITKEPKKVHGTNKVKYMKNVLEKLGQK